MLRASALHMTPFEGFHEEALELQPAEVGLIRGEAEDDGVDEDEA